jgi:hypothetical protein
MIPKRKYEIKPNSMSNIITSLLKDTSCTMHNSDIKECALIAANEMLNDIIFINNTDQEEKTCFFDIHNRRNYKPTQYSVCL